MLSWNKRRQLVYFSSILAFFLVLAIGYYLYNKPKPSCFDGKENGTETGLDCGGSCLKVCVEEVIPISTIWIRPFEIISGQYTVVGVFENRNRDLGVGRLFYKIRLINSFGATVGERSGETFVNPQEKFVIFEPGFDLKGEKPVRVFIDFDQAPNWAKPVAPKSTMSVIRKSLEIENGARIHAVLTNESPYDLQNIVVPVLLSDESKNTFTGSQTVVDTLARGASVDIYFTWPTVFDQNPAFVDFYPRVNLFND
jgi:hypothetical protein